MASMRRLNEGWELECDVVSWFSCGDECMPVIWEDSQEENRKLVLHRALRGQQWEDLLTEFVQQGWGSSMFAEGRPVPEAQEGCTSIQNKRSRVEGIHPRDMSDFPYLATRKLNINTHHTRLSSITNTHFRWVKESLSLIAPNGLSFVLLQRCLLRIQQCILMSHPAASEGSWPTSKRQGMSSSQSVPKRR